MGSHLRVRENGRAQCTSGLPTHNKSADQNGILDHGITVGMGERDDRAPWTRREKSKALCRTGGNAWAHTRHISELYRGRRQSRRTRIFSRSDCLERHTELTSRGNSKSPTGASGDRNPGWIVAAARREEGDANNWNQVSHSAVPPYEQTYWHWCTSDRSVNSTLPVLMGSRAMSIG